MSSLPVLTFPPPASALALLPTPSQPPSQALNVVEDGEDKDSNDNGLPPEPPGTRWFFDKERLDNTPSRRSGMDADKELTLRQQSANFIQDIGQRLQV